MSGQVISLDEFCKALTEQVAWTGYVPRDPAPRAAIDLKTAQSKIQSHIRKRARRDAEIRRDGGPLYVFM